MTELRFQRIDDSNRRDHTHLAPTDICIFLREYTRGAGFSSESNSLVSNLKKKKGAGGYHYKAGAILQCAREIVGGADPAWLKVITLVPVPPSKAKTDPHYDDRIVKVCKAIGDVATNADVQALGEAPRFNGGAG